MKAISEVTIGQPLPMWRSFGVKFDATPFWQGEVSPLLARADGALYVAKRKAAIASRWRRSCWFRRPEREGKFEQGAVNQAPRSPPSDSAVFPLL